MSLARFGVSLDENILKALDDFAVGNNFPNRSQAIRFLIEKNIVERKWLCNNLVAGAIVLVYDHQKSEISSRVAEIQREYFEVILSSSHFHLSNEICLEIVAVKGLAYKLTELSDKLISLKGIKHGKLVMSKTD
jgi:CopG family nickel-responsive transcriptional regulator